MSDLIRLTYASMATSKPAVVQNELIDILNQSRRFNSKHCISGVLFYNNNYFFQCLEGERTQLFKLYDTISKDPRHTKVVQLACENIQVPAFSHWQMKYVLEDYRIRQFFVTHYGQAFDPYLLNDEFHQEFIQLLVNSPQASVLNTDFSINSINFQDKKPFYASAKFSWFVIIPIIVICLFIYIFSGQ